MSRTRAPGAAQEQARRVIRHLLGSGDAWVVGAMVALLVGLGWFTDSLFEWLADFETWFAGGVVQNWWPLHRLIAVGFFLSVLAVLGLLAQGARRLYRPRVASEPAPAAVHGLILFLSNLRAADAEAIKAALGDIRGIGDFRDRFGGLNWRMPLEAIAYHLSRLQHVLVICSRTERRSTGPDVPGSSEQLRLFRELVQRTFPGAAFALRDSAQLDTRYTGGLDFEDVDAVSQVTDDAYADLVRRGLPNAEILIDVTGGQKPNAVAATAVALAEGRRIQYVACERGGGECRVKVYDVTYDQ